MADPVNPAPTTAEQASQLLDNVVAQVEKIDWKSERDAFIARGHEIITTELARAKSLGSREINALLPVIEQTLRSLFSHIVDPHSASAPQPADTTHDLPA